MKKFYKQALALLLSIFMILPACAATKPYTKGDANLDEKISIVDVALLRSYIIGNTTLNPEKLKVADVNNDNKINITDVVMIRAHIIGSLVIKDTVEVDVDKYPSEELTKKTFSVTEENVKTLGRTYYYKDAMWLIQSADTVEFEFTGTKGSITVHGDQNAFSDWAQNNLCRLGIFVNGELVVDELVDNYVKEYTFLDTDKETNANVKIVKLSDPAQSVVGIHKISVTSRGDIKPTEEKDLKIEFIGDSITCGIGVDDPNVDGVYCTASCNASKTYAYKLAQKFDADYSFFAYSGYGCLSGYRGTTKPDTKATIPPIYGTYGTSMGYFGEDLDPEELEWDFSSYQPDLVIINLGTNDANYTKTAEKKAEFTASYLAFIKQIKEKYPNAKILGVLGLGGASLYTPIKNAVNAYNEETGTNDVDYLKLSPIQEGDGAGVQNHPLEITHARAAGEIEAKLTEWLGWEVK